MTNSTIPQTSDTTQLTAATYATLPFSGLRGVDCAAWTCILRRTRNDRLLMHIEASQTQRKFSLSDHRSVPKRDGLPAGSTLLQLLNQQLKWPILALVTTQCFERHALCAPSTVVAWECMTSSRVALLGASAAMRHTCAALHNLQSAHVLARKSARFDNSACQADHQPSSASLSCAFRCSHCPRPRAMRRLGCCRTAALCSPTGAEASPSGSESLLR